MFEPGPPVKHSPLRQGDVCGQVWCPSVETNTAVLLPTRDKQQPWDGVSRPKYFVVEPREVAVMVLSQSCDLERLETSTVGRILICPVTGEDQSPAFKEYRDARGQDINFDVVDAAMKTGEPPKKLANATRAVKKAEESDLASLWLGSLGGAFPVAQIGEPGKVTVPRSVCHFDLAMTVPREPWLTVLKQRRLRHMSAPWLALLQEHLSEWLGRFAFPGSNEERLACSEHRGPSGSLKTPAEGSV